MGNGTSLINTAAEFASYTSITEQDISIFNIVGNDLEIRVEVEWAFNSFTFLNRQFTYLIEIDGFLTKIGNASFRSNESLHTVDCIGLETIQTNGFLQCFNLINVNLPALQTIDTQGFQSCTKLKEVNFPVLNNTGTRIFNGCALLENVSIPTITNLGGSNADNEVFLGCNSLQTVTAPIAMQTINGGSPDGDLAYADNVLGATIIYV